MVKNAPGLSETKPIPIRGPSMRKRREVEAPPASHCECPARDLSRTQSREAFLILAGVYQVSAKIPTIRTTIADLLPSSEQHRSYFIRDTKVHVNVNDGKRVLM